MRRPLPLLALALGLAACQGTATSTARRDYPGANPNLPFSSAVAVGDTVYIAGHLGVDPATGRAPADATEEIRLMLDRFSETLARADLTMDNLVQVQVFCSDVSLYDTFNGLYRERFTRAFPVRAFIGSGRLLRGARFEIQGIAAR